MNAPLLATSKEQLDQILALVCVELQISETQFAEAERSYRSVGDWLDAPESKLAVLRPEIFPQGSISLGTTVKPRRREEFDIDLVCLLQRDRTALEPMVAYGLVLERIQEHGTYRKMVQTKPRCIRIEYEGQFHLDIIPACPAPRGGVPWGDLALVIPDREKRAWISTNPRGFAQWFASRATSPERDPIQLSVEPLPPNQGGGSKTVLQGVVQLFKRRRDVHFNGDDVAPKSILLTTIDAGLHDGEDSLVDAVLNILASLEKLGRECAQSTAPVVQNPTDPDENLARQWQENPRSFSAFIEYVLTFRDGMRRLTTAQGMERIAAILNELFDPTGSGVIDRAIRTYTERVQDVRSAGRLRVRRAVPSLTTVAASPKALGFPGTSFYGVEK